MFDQDINTNLNYLHDNGTRPAIWIGGNREDLKRSHEYEPHRVVIRDGRAGGRDFRLEDEGFTLLRKPTSAVDFADERHILDVYYPETAGLIANATGASQVVIFDHTLRFEDAPDDGTRKPVQHVHNDYTDRSAPRRVLDIMGGERGRELLKGRFLQLNAWRPLGHAVETTPLAVADARSIGDDDVIPTDLVYPDRNGEILEFAYNPDHQWFYFPDMSPDEILLIKGYDSHAVNARFVPHSAFELPHVRENARPRRSIELRAFAFFGAV